MENGKWKMEPSDAANHVCLPNYPCGYSHWRNSHNFRLAKEDPLYARQKL
jgi:hypothetical protein